jgi:hypothetical protein
MRAFRSPLVLVGRVWVLVFGALHVLVGVPPNSLLALFQEPESSELVYFRLHTALHEIIVAPGGSGGVPPASPPPPPSAPTFACPPAEPAVSSHCRGPAPPYVPLVSPSLALAHRGLQLPVQPVGW